MQHKVRIYYEGVVATEDNERVLFLIATLEQQNPTPKQSLDLYNGWQNIFRIIKASYDHSEKQQQLLHEAVVRCSVLDYVLYGKRIKLVESNLN